MVIAKNPGSAIAEADLQALIDGGVREDRTTEFKRDTYGGSDDAKAEFLKDISALANTLGGDLVLGIDEAQGVATALPGLRFGTDVDQEIRRLTQIAQTGLQPRLPALSMDAVPLASGAHALVIRVGRSYVGPHRVRFGGRNRFWARTDAGNQEPDVDQLRELFLAAPHIAARLRELRGERVALILAGETPVPLQDEPGVAILHIVPFVATASTPFVVDLGRLVAHRQGWALWGAISGDTRRNFDGFVACSGTGGQHSRSYCQVFRSGMVEIVETGVVSNPEATKIVWVHHLAKTFLKQVEHTLDALRQADIPAPYAVHLTLSGVRGATFQGRRPYPHDDPPYPSPQARDLLPFADTVITEEQTSPEQIAAALRPTLDQLFQTASSMACPWFDAHGAFSPAR